MVRASIARQTGQTAWADAHPPGIVGRGHAHAGFAMLPLARGGDASDGACLIEPAVRCNHCGYCLSYGH